MQAEAAGKKHKAESKKAFAKYVKLRHKAEK